MIGAIIAKSKVTSSYDLLNNRDIKNFLKNWHDDAAFVFPGNIKAAGTFKGKEAIEGWFNKLLDQFPTFNITPKKVCIQSLFDFVGTNVVTVEWDEDNINKDGKRVQVSGVTVITLRFGKATHVKDYLFATDEELKEAWSE
ncbi:MAG: nuclear transport factor 2 family protein [Deltaproteobacteria bacterium]|nr:nuclear transport factor 2 family protein [Deltaproteobacteria bacterium]NNK86473.1 nuclear transport factor 2 family protein [Desulfobacterales bacterium]